MDKLFAGAIVAAAIATLAGTAQAADNTCIWTGADWACGDGNVITKHYTQAAGPGVPITPIATIDQARIARLSDVNRPR